MLVNSELKGAQLERLAEDPLAADSYESRVYTNTTFNQARIFLDGVWTPLGSGSGDMGAVDIFSGDGTTVAFTLGGQPPAETSLQVFVSGVFFDPTRYALASNVITFSTVPPTGTDNIVIYRGAALNIGEPGDNSVSTVKIQDGAVTREKLADSAVGLTVTPTTLTSAQTITDPTSSYIRVDSSSGTFSLTIPSAASTFVGQRLVINKIDISINPVTLVGGFSGQLSTQGETLELLNTGTEWVILSRRVPSNWIPYTFTGSFDQGVSQTEAYFKRIGDSARFRVRQVWNNSSTSNVSFSTSLLPVGLSIDSAKQQVNPSSTLLYDAGVVLFHDVDAQPSGGFVGFTFVVTNTRSFALYQSGSIFRVRGLTGIQVGNNSANGGMLTSDTLNLSTNPIPILGWDD